ARRASAKASGGYVLQRWPVCQSAFGASSERPIWSVCHQRGIMQWQASSACPILWSTPGMSLQLSYPITDSYSYQNYQRQRQLTLGDLLLENRIVFLQGEIYTGNDNEVVVELIYWEGGSRGIEVHVYTESS